MAFRGLDIQNSILDTMTALMTELRVKGKTQHLPFQTAIMISNKSLKCLYEDLQRRFRVEYILTYRLNQDVLENFFGVIRSKCGLHDHPDPLEFKYRLRSYILGRNEGALSAGGNVEEDDTPSVPADNLLSVQYLALVSNNDTCLDDAAKENIDTELD